MQKVRGADFLFDGEVLFYGNTFPKKFGTVDYHAIYEDLKSFLYSTSNHIEVHFNNEGLVQEDELWSLKSCNGRMCAVYLYNQDLEEDEDLGMTLSLHRRKFKLDACQCGDVGSVKKRSQTQFFIKSRNANNCLSGKVSVDHQGLICNCASMRERFGNVGDAAVDLRKIFYSENFRRMWNITKDTVETCKDCEFRYACLDCRCFLSGRNINSKPLKCSYKP